ncbi:MAG TPA: NDP-sugar synthase [Pyrinomonadaceae bacterium]|nr:NDP-sugar synthase [Pyrinomonadaceae bacterium]
MRAIILAAGYGTRLWPLTVDRTKPAIPFLGKPLVGYVAEYLSHFQIRDVVVNLHHRPESVRAALGDSSRFRVHLEYVEEETILGTSGAIDNARHLLDGDTFFAVNGKIVTDIDLAVALATHRQREALATLVLLPNAGRERFSMVETHDGLVTGFGGMPAPLSPGEDPSDERGVPLMFTGIQILEPRIFDYIPRGVFSHSVTDVYPQAIARGEKVVAHVATGRWYELSTIPRYLDISLTLLKDRGADLQVGEDCLIASGADVRESVLWDGVRIEEGARVRRAVLGDGVVIGSHETIENAAVVRAELVRGTEAPPKALKGEFRGGNFVVPLSE